MTSSKRSDQRFEDQLNRRPPGADEIFIPKPPPKSAPVPGRNDQEIQRLRDMVEQLEQRTNALAIQDDGTLSVQGFQLSPTGLVAPEDMTQEGWEQIGLLLFKLEGSIQWLIGDWLAYGISLEYGDIPRIAEALGRDPKTLHNYKQICENVEFTRRRVDLTFGHHEVVRSLGPDEQIEALAYAAENGEGGKPLSVSKFRQWLKEQQGEAITLPSTPPSHDGFVSIAKEASRFIEHDPSTLKAEERAAGLSYIQRMRAVFDAWEAKARS